MNQHTEPLDNRVLDTVFHKINRTECKKNKKNGRREDLTPSELASPGAELTPNFFRGNGPQAHAGAALIVLKENGVNESHILGPSQMHDTPGQQDSMRSQITLKIDHNSFSPISEVNAAIRIGYVDDSTKSYKSSYDLEMNLRYDNVSSLSWQTIGKPDQIPDELKGFSSAIRKPSGRSPWLAITFRLKPDTTFGARLYANFDCGPCQPQVNAVRDRLTRGGRLIFLAPNATLLRYELNAWWTGRPGQGTDFLLSPDSQVLHPRDVFKSRNDLDPLAFMPMVVFCADREGLNILQSALKQDWEYIQHFTPAFLNGSSWFVAVPHRDENELILFVGEGQRIRNKLRLKNHDSVLVRCDNHEWAGVIMASSALTPRDALCIRVTRQQTENGAWLGANLRELADVVDIGDLRDPRTIRAAIEAGQRKRVDIRQAESPYVYNTKSDLLASLAEQLCSPSDNASEWIRSVRELFNLGRLDRLRTVDVLSELELTDDDVDALLARLGEGPQADAIRQLRHAPGRLLLLEGPAGSGKTHTFLELDAAVLRRRCAASGDNPLLREGNRTLCASATHEHVSRLAVQASKLYSSITPDALVVVFLSWETAQNMIQREVDETFAASLPENHPLWSDYVASIRAGPNDRRVIDVEERFRLPTLLRLAVSPHTGSLPQGLSPAVLDRIRAQIPADHLANICDAFDALNAQRKATDAQNRGEAKAATRRLSEALMAVYPLIFDMADMIACTTMAALSETLRTNFHPRLIIIDEASRVDAVESLLWTVYNPVGVILAGDIHQLGPYQNSTLSFNGFMLQLAFPQMKRMIIAGCPAIRFCVQRRFCQDIADLLDRYAYRIGLKAHISAAKAGILAQAFPEIENLRKDAGYLLLNMENTTKDGHFQRTGDRSSRHNPRTAQGTWMSIDHFLQAGRREEEIGIVVSYDAQRTDHRAIANGRALQEGRRSGIMVETVEKWQGSQRPVIIFDIPNTTSPGFLDTRSRVVTAASRAMEALVVVVDRDLMRSWSNDDNALVDFVNTVGIWGTTHSIEFGVEIPNVKEHMPDIT